MDRRDFLKGMISSGVMVSSSGDLLSETLHTKKSENRNRPDVNSRNNVPAAIKLIGIGGCGITVVNAAITHGLQNVDYIAIDTDAEVLKRSKAVNAIHVNSFMSCMIDERVLDDATLVSDVGKKMLAPYADRIAPLIADAEKIFIVAGLGGETSMITLAIAEIAHNSGAPTTAIVTFPFGFEGLRKHCTAEDCVAAMEQRHYKTVLIVNDRFVNRQETLNEYFSRCDQHIVDIINNS